MQNSFVRLLVLTVAAALAVATAPIARAQGVVSSGITGTLADDAGKPVAGATVTALHVPTNTSYSAVSNAAGRFSFRGLRVGGPYTISAQAQGYEVRSLSNVDTILGEDTDVSLIAQKEVLELEKFVAVGSRTTLDANATGAGSVLSSRRIATQPTASRSFADMMKTNPFVAIRAFPQVTALGMNNRYNSITLDGARINDQFGLASAGLLSLKNPFSLDAVEQFSISLTPYDVTQSGFAGASVNVVSKSGTNVFHGSAYYIYTSDQWQGKDVSGTTAGTRATKFYDRTWGATLGGPIIKDKLFFFLNYEKVNNPSGAPSNPGFNPDPAFLTFIQAQIAALPGKPDLGTYGGAGANLETDTKRLAKLDWQITNDHRLTVRYSDTEGSRPNFGSFNPGTGFSNNISMPGVSNTGYNNGITSLSSSYYSLAILEEVWAAQLFSSWSPDFKTQFNFSKNDSSSLRTTPAIFPEIRILNVPGTSVTTGAPVSTSNAFSFGTEVSSMGNGGIFNTISYGGIADYTWRNIDFKAGFDHEETDFENLFRAGSYGVFAYNYSPTLNLATDAPLSFARSVAQ
ncbi:MAG: TonB-dependent receptor, partial [Opitutaceae bacterium]|nr:TonB-dependent receptor [Opitutaceae bacterium]